MIFAQSSNCFQDKVAVQVNSSTTHRYCGNGQFNIQSESNTMVVTLQSPIWSRGGRFACEVRSVKRSQDSENCECGWKNPVRIYLRKFIDASFRLSNVILSK